MKHKTIILVLCISMVVITITLSTAMNQSYIKTGRLTHSELPLQLTELGGVESEGGTLKALLKGSIYESGENMTVFGACFDGYGYLIPDSNATITSWYPNGTVWEQDSQMWEVLNSTNETTGRFNYQVDMTTVMGTYLTEITCNYNGETAQAYGEWQNPEWVKRIKDTQDYIYGNLTNLSIEHYNNLTTQINNFSSDVQNNFTELISKINNISVSMSNVTIDGWSNLTGDVSGVLKHVQSLDTPFWSLDPNAPWYTLGSGVFNFTSVDMTSLNAVGAASSDGYIVSYDGETWSQDFYSSDLSWHGISLLPGDTPYVVAVGRNTTSDIPVYYNNGVVQERVTGDGSTPSDYLDVKIYFTNDSPAGQFSVYIITNDGQILQSTDSGSTFSQVDTFSANGTHGRIAYLVKESGYEAAFAMNDELIHYDGSYTTYTPYGSGALDISGVSMYAPGIIYLTSNASEVTVINNGVTSQHYALASDLIYNSIDVDSLTDGWLIGTDSAGSTAAVVYRWNGNTWEYYQYPYGSTGLGISFTGSSGAPLADMSMINSRYGYAVGADGMIAKLNSYYDNRLQKITTQLTSSLANHTVTQNMINDTQNLIIQLNTSLYDVNASLSADLADVLSRIDNMNNTVHVKLDQILANTTYTQLYLETTLFPLMNSTYQNTISILAQLGIISTQLNTTIDIVNDTNIKVDDIYNATAGRIHAWVTV